MASLCVSALSLPLSVLMPVSLCCHLILVIYHIVCLCPLSMGPPRIPAYIISHPHARRVYDIHSLFFTLAGLLCYVLRLHCVRRSGSIPLPSVVVASYSEDLQSKEDILQAPFSFLSFSYPFIPPVLLHALLLRLHPCCVLVYLLLRPTCRCPYNTPP